MKANGTTTKPKAKELFGTPKETFIKENSKMTSARARALLRGAMEECTTEPGAMASSMVVVFLSKMRGLDALEFGRAGVTLNGLTKLELSDYL